MTMSRRKLIAGNWKMNGLLVAGESLAKGLVEGLKATPSAGEVLVCPPFTLLHPIAAALVGSGVALGGQDCVAAPAGAHTGDIAANMLADIGCSHVILGHSERRHDHGESDAVVQAKVVAAWAAKLVTIVCVGETLAERDSGEAVAVVRRQLLGSLPQGSTPENLVIAYEPVWAIGTGRVAAIEDVAQMHAAIREVLAAGAGGLDADGAKGVRILYGGSVKADNARPILALEDVDGALVGGASLKASDFIAIALSF